MHNLILYGGTFDPIHWGHLKTAINVQSHFNFEQFLFLPCKVPLLKNNAVATPAQRIEMIELAIAPYKKQYNFNLDLSEINRETPSYMLDSLQHFRSQWGDNLSLTLLMGEDAFSRLTSWHHWIKLIDLTNILLIKRAGHKEVFSDELNKFLDLNETTDSTALKKQPHGLIYRFDAGNYQLSSSGIRAQINLISKKDDCLPPAVLAYIKQNNLYFSS
ncbi:MAG: nicotinate-nucleotide adenylyltransferase [Tatlockia sp.]|nr:nicotinate-nucleotide adenylyltransferase [Tatlockia sp.]